ncbi:MAG: MarR family transcriptional regulator, transcriptional regulator for hemolysin [Azoarcus sp.]|uniref:DNA-binding transcriptional regulator, MarR family n=1 Tax=Aromatoleum tolulyticum TaxID=34027 RepID=A0A1N7AET0_9RHOO|nr:MarR family transcriptional regulator [Aromatoleum tolulyticum]MCK9987583.1 MarR family transcriptional regulator, transcriptional regulator for hemolysin [Azoarcus sp.]SIR37595.1 DNA-binding transcriptional regulator, MarR family [Aromatoleum tolulyticum]
MQGFFRSYLSVYRPLIQALNQLLQPHELSYSLWQVMLYAQEHAHASLVEISQYYGIEKPGVTRRVQRLEELGYLSCVPGNDRREKSVALTEQGQRVYSECRVKITALEQGVTAGIDVRALEQTAAVFRQLLGNLK